MSKENTTAETELATDLGAVADALVEQARVDGVDLTGPGGLLTGLVQRVLQGTLESEMTDHLGYEPHAPRRQGVGQQPQRALPHDGPNRDRRCRCPGAQGSEPL